jgi:hypothetical protein
MPVAVDRENHSEERVSLVHADRHFAAKISIPYLQELFTQGNY